MYVFIYLFIAYAEMSCK